MLIKCHSSVNRVLTEMSLECWSRCWMIISWTLIKGINEHSTVDAFSTHKQTNEWMEYKLTKLQTNQQNHSPISMLLNSVLHNRPQHEALGSKPHKLCSYSPETRTDVYCFRLNFNILKLVYYLLQSSWSMWVVNVLEEWCYSGEIDMKSKSLLIILISLILNSYNKEDIHQWWKSHPWWPDTWIIMETFICAPLSSGTFDWILRVRLKNKFRNSVSANFVQPSRLHSPSSVFLLKTSIIILVSALSIVKKHSTESFYYYHWETER